jgi:hypothetical protein
MCCRERCTFVRYAKSFKRSSPLSLGYDISRVEWRTQLKSFQRIRWDEWTRRKKVWYELCERQQTEEPISLNMWTALFHRSMTQMIAFSPIYRTVLDRWSTSYNNHLMLSRVRNDAMASDKIIIAVDSSATISASRLTADENEMFLVARWSSSAL